VRPAWLDATEYPFASHWLPLGPGRLHYLDEGDRRPIVMVHGTPTWSFLYRHLVLALRDRYRCIAPDNLGFGLSDKPSGASYRPEDQARRLAKLIEALHLKDITLIVHDYGGPIGMAYALERPDNVRSLVLFNTWLWSLAPDPHFARVGRLLSSPFGRFLYERFAFSARVVWRHAVKDRSRYTAGVHRHYLRPLDDPGARYATWVYAREVLGSSAWYDSLWNRRHRIAALPALVVWGTKDPAFGHLLDRWRSVFERMEVVEMSDVGHAPPEERGPETAALVARFLDR